MKTYKDLHLATSIEALNALAAKVDYNKNIRKFDQLVRSATSLSKHIYSDPLDEEMTYIYIVRYLTLYNHIRKMINDDKFVKLRFEKDVCKAQIQLEETKKSLMRRYESLKKEKMSEEKPTIVVPLVEEQINTFGNDMFVNCQQVRDVCLHGGNILIMDARPSKDYKDSHLKSIENTNIPAEIINVGLSAHRLGLDIPPESKSKWDKRDTYDVLVLMDWNTNQETYQNSKLHKLMMILMEWDPNTTYTEEPKVLNGGYLEFLQMYPTLCSNPHVIYNVVNRDLDEILLLDEIEYPSEGGDPISTLNKGNPQVDIVQPPSPTKDLEHQESRCQILDEERTVTVEKQEVEKELLTAEKLWKTLHAALDIEQNENKRAALLTQEKAITDTIQGLEDLQNDLNNRKYELAKRYSQFAGFMPSREDSNQDFAKLKEIQQIEKESEKNHKIIAEMAADRQRLLEYARSQKPQLGPVSDGKDVRTILKPQVDRMTKPSYNRGAIDINEMPIKTVADGLVGLKNIRNTCYMNALIQCIRHVPELMHLFCSGNYARHVVRKPDVIIRELAVLVRQLWTTTQKSIKPDEFYSAICKVNATYRRGNHEDCMEFFLFLFGQLSDDCATELEASNILTPVQLAWVEQLQGKTSYFIEQFYHQVKVLYLCLRCGKKTLKFETENTVMLCLSDDGQEAYDLDDLINDYLKYETHSHLMCSRCKIPVSCTRTISLQPKILGVILKRGSKSNRRSGSKSTEKNDAPVEFKLDNLKFGKSLYKLSGIVMHIGTVSAGHYTAACFNPVVNKWMEYNDEDVRTINMRTEDVKSKACMYFYIQKNE